MLSRRLSNTLDARFCTEALTEALERYSRPEIFNTDQGSQFTSLQFTSVLKDSGVAISMDDSGRCMNNIFIERLWRPLRYAAAYLHELSDGFRAKRLISRWFAFYDRARPHSTLGGSIPAAAYEEGMLTQRLAQRRNSPAPPPTLPEQQNASKQDSSWHDPLPRNTPYLCRPTVQQSGPTSLRCNGRPVELRYRSTLSRTTLATPVSVAIPLKEFSEHAGN